MRLRRLEALPHARGGVSAQKAVRVRVARSSPRPWGCFLSGRPFRQLAGLFPTPVGVFPIALILGVSSVSLPHARGGVSARKTIRSIRYGSSPRPWGCFCLIYTISDTLQLFPTPVGVFLGETVYEFVQASLPHARGGVSGFDLPFVYRRASSPRPWGCFCQQILDVRVKELFPTPVGVFPQFYNWARLCEPLPHARGGVSGCYSSGTASSRSSPRPGGCFWHIKRRAACHFVFPTPGGVFPRSGSGSACGKRLPHARGGVSKRSGKNKYKATSSPRPWRCFL